MYKSGNVWKWEPGEIRGISLPADLWFSLHQDLLLKYVNTEEGRNVLSINQHKTGKTLGNKFPIINITKESITYQDLFGNEKISTFWSGSMLGDQMRVNWEEVSKGLRRFYDPEDQGKLIRLNTPSGVLQAATVTTFNPDGHTESSSVDGRVTDDSNGNLTMTALAAEGGSYSGESESTAAFYVIAGSSTDRFDSLGRFFMLYNSASIDDDDEISAAKIVCQMGASNSTTVNEGLTGYALNVTASNPASSTALAIGDFDAVSDTAFATAVAVSALNTSAGQNWEDLNFNATGISAIAKAGISKFCIRYTADITDTAGNWSSGANVLVVAKAAEDSTAGNRPELTVTHAPAATAANIIRIF